ncbi:choice-of-anchor J domain-containing protein [Formosa maritima]|uniref:T9SS type B sorting domain-containing protein n=1 Tax=Formosa maritima TaxID=2592046 RepID=A0A5D0GFX9_9FLAO|nr:choice-of-anchor J domain-containing protein [Formosa maritima]TYA56717.1 T9SS type B sorting domain-containing protein [Formosa maritima]
MRNTLQNNVAKTYLVSTRNLNEFNSTAPKKSIKKRIFYFVASLAIILMISNKGYAQINETFDTGIPSSWTLFGNGIGTSEWSSTPDGYLGTQGTSINPSADNIGSGNTAQYFLVTPQISVPENGEIHFYTKQASAIDNGAQYQIRISTAAQPDINGFNIVLQSYTETNLNLGLQTEYEKKVVEIPSSIPVGFNIYLAFVAVNTQNGASPSGDEWFVDEVAVLEGCTEIDSDSVIIDNITVDSAEVTWTHPTATNFEIQILPSGGTPADSGIPVVGTSYTLVNLDEQTEFDIYIAAICDNDTQSDFTGPYTFETLKYGLSCDEPIVIPDISTNPYVLVDNLQNWANPNETYTTEGTNCISGGFPGRNYLNGDKVFLTYTPTEDGLLTLTTTTAVVTGGGTNNCYNNQTSLLVYESCDDVGVNCIAGVNTVEEFAPRTISNLVVQAGQTYVIVLSSEHNSGAGICFELVISSPTCAPPGEIVYNSLTDSSVSLSWDNNGGFADSWEYAVVPTGAGEPTGLGTPTNSNSGNVVTGLTTSTTYDAYVRSVCNGAPGIWSLPSTFTTQCSTFGVPYSTDFNTATNENPEPCWTTIDVNRDNVTWGFLAGYATLWTADSRNVNNDYYVSPRINFDGTPKRVRYKQRATQGVSTYSLKLSTTGIGLDDFTTVLLPQTQTNSTSFTEIIVDIPENITGDVNIAWIVEPNSTETASRFSIDDVFIEDKPTCPDPLNPLALQITTNSAWFLWTAGDIETQWEVAIQDLNSGVPTGSGILTTSNFPHIATGLESGHRYEYYVRAYCDTDDQSDWIGPVAFTTLCESYDTPFYESFNEADPNTQKFCWKITDGNGDGTKWMIDDEHAFMQTSAFQPATSYNDYLISPAINLDGNTKEIKFKYRADFTFFTAFPRFGLEVLMSTTNTSLGSFSVISPLEIFNNPEYQERSIIINGTGTVYIALRIPPEFNVAEGYSLLSIDDFSITDAPACPNPSDLTVNSVTVNSAELSWTLGYQETDWDIVVQTAGSGVPTGNGEAVTASNYSATGLSPDTEYEFYVMANCGTEESEWVGPVTFRTPCTPYSTPFVETFNSDSSTQDCWMVVNNNHDLRFWELDSAFYPYEGDQTAAMFTGTNGQNEDWLISPTITITENQRLRYYYRVNDSFFTEDLEVLLSTNGTSLDQFTTVLYDSDDDPVVLNNDEYLVKIINFPDGLTGDINIAFRVPFFPSTGPYRGQTLAIDNVNIEDIPNCPPPTNISLTGLTDTQVQVGWDINGAETAWEISVQPSGTPAPVGDTDPNYLYNASTNPFLITGLTSSTMYDIYVRAVCNGESTWTGPVEVLTPCSFENLCQYTFVLTSDAALGSLEITQNNQVAQSIGFNGNVSGAQFPIFLCSGVQFSVYFHTSGWAASQYENFQFEILNDQGVSVFTSPIGLIPRTTYYTGTAVCGAIACPQPTDLTINDTNTISWTPGGTETQWEVAIQPFENGTIPQSGTVVSNNFYTLTDVDFSNPNAASYEYFVRAICGTDNQSYWSGPFEFIRNNDISNAIVAPINSSETCDQLISNVSFIGATPSPETMSCDGINDGDVWFKFVAESRIHIIKAINYSGTLRDTDIGYPEYPNTIMTLYREISDGNIEEVICSYDNIITAMYSSELIVGDTYFIRFTKTEPATTEYTLELCITTPENFCNVETENGGFEQPVVPGLSGLNSMITSRVVPGWRQNFDNRNQILVWESLNAPGISSFEGSQCAQILEDEEMIIDPNDPEVYGIFREFDTSESTVMDYNFAYLGRFDGNALQLFAGPPGGPYTLVREQIANTFEWIVVSGQYQVPNNQDLTRFIFRASGSDVIGNVIDAVSFNSNNDIITSSSEVDCTDPTIIVEANGTGTWIPDPNNPGEVIIDDVTSNNTSISGFLQSGVYTFTWQTRYCENTVEFTYNGISDMPTVETPVAYCLNATAQPLSATPTGSYSLIWYTQPVGGTGSTTAPTPDTSVVGDTSYYVANADTNGCESPRAEIIVTVNDAIIPELSFSYETTCIVVSDNPIPTLSTGFETGGIFSSATLTVDSTTGEIDLSSATVGIHDVLYTFDGDSETCLIAETYTATIEFTAASTPVTTFDYGTEPFCLITSTTVLPNLATGFTTGGIFSSTTLTVDASSGEIDLTSATTGMHDVIYTIDADSTICMEASTYTTSIEVLETIVPVTMFSYAEDFYCTSSGNVFPDLATNFTSGGVFSAESGLTINATTGEINFSTSTAGSYTISYTITEDLTTCLEASVSTFIMNIAASVTPVTMFDYGTTPFCLLSGDSVLPNLATGFTTGGTFSSTTLTVAATTGEVDLTSATAGTHDVIYTYDADASNCIESGTYTASIEIIQVTSTISEFSYTEDLYCEDSPNILPNLAPGFTTGGTFSAESGLSINASTGEINISSSNIGNYTIVYEITEDLTNCVEGSMSTFDMTILDTIEVSIDGECNQSDYLLTASPVGNSFDPNDVTYTWMDANGNVVGNDSEVFNVTGYANQNQNVTVPAQFTVTITFGSCSVTASFTTDILSCGNIPRGISPDGNGKNDTFDLTGFGVTHIEIFNRYGKTVFKYNGNYTNQWHGQSDKGKTLPDGTYYYSIKKEDGSSVTGWVFINGPK